MIDEGELFRRFVLLHTTQMHPCAIQVNQGQQNGPKTKRISIRQITNAATNTDHPGHRTELNPPSMLITQKDVLGYQSFCYGCLYCRQCVKKIWPKRQSRIMRELWGRTWRRFHSLVGFTWASSNLRRLIGQGSGNWMVARNHRSQMTQRVLGHAAA